MSWELLVSNFQMRLEKNVIFETFQIHQGVDYLKLLDET